MSDDITARARDLLAGPKPYFHRDKQAYSCLSELLAEVERLRAGREVERQMLHAGAAEIQDLAFKVEQLQSEQDEDRDEIHTLRRHLADEEAEVERLKGALDRVQQFETALRMPADHNIPPRYQQFIGNIRGAVADELRDVLRGDQ